MPMIRSVVKLLIISVSLTLPPLISAGVVVYGTGLNGGLAGFNVAAGSPPVSLTFDGIAPGTDITGSTLQGVQLVGPNAPLVVVRGADTVTPGGFAGVVNSTTNQLLPTSGLNVLSPGGTVLGPGTANAIENDDLTLIFNAPLPAFGLDFLWQSADGFSAIDVQVFNQANVQLFSGTVPISNLGGGGAPGSSDFWGVMGTGGDLIGRIVIDEFDGDAVFPDSNIGFDSFRFVVQVVPEPTSLALLVPAGAALALRYSRRRTSEDLELSA